jgi:hypothetical protein
MVVVRVADQVNRALTGHHGYRYEGPPQGREQALAQVEVLVGCTAGSPDSSRVELPIASGRRTITRVPLDWNHDGGE